jgi:DNA-directed RNA polymerase subunit K/omega
MDKDNSLYDLQEILMHYEVLKKSNKTKPVLSKYERTKILGLRAQQLASGSKALINVPAHVTETLDIAEMELEQRKIPYILKREIGNRYEYWKLEDLNY